MFKILLLATSINFVIRKAKEFLYKEEIKEPLDDQEEAKLNHW